MQGRRRMSALAWLGQQGTRGVAALVLIAIVAPPLGAALKPFVAPAIFLLLTIAFLRVDLVAVRSYIRRPALVLAATSWTMLVIPLAIGAATSFAALGARSPELRLGVMLQAVASPMMAAPSFAALMGLDATLVLITLVAASALTPITAPLFTYPTVGAVLTLSPLELGVRLLIIVAGSACVGVLFQRLIGHAVVQRRARELDGVNILVAFVFVAAVMEHVGETVMSQPRILLALCALGFAVFFLIFGATVLVFARAGRERALALGFMAAQRNMGLMLAATGGALPDLTWLYFAACQLPIYLSPQLLKSLVRRRI